MFEIKFHDAFKEELKSLPDSLELRMVALIKRLRENPTSLREPHSKPIEGYKGLFELRAKAKGGIARSFFLCRREENLSVTMLCEKNQYHSPE
ncbi:type II toxin-antitoxin system RelE/ParE family toxin [Xenorhabdus bovienii]|uniref:type II toxin-antitoxin system RelE/ParE family toxin n=1 Tax=Xenorhabdus bovienii TaxID=40576 RepID=UPI001EDFFE60|nr:type II toxin-antitoxin system RelE/ParE family toxin [Xenorhabdus bovienii]MCG3470198.1 type II toxin-antitoxin system RelE/ParE family toxin [Xenorhabdus bovienii]